MTTCSVVPTSIRHSTDLQYKSAPWWLLKGTKNATNQGVASLQQKNVGFRCVSDEKTGWLGTTLGTVVVAGKTYYARVHFDKVELNCGG